MVNVSFSHTRITCPLAADSYAANTNRVVFKLSAPVVSATPVPLKASKRLLLQGTMLECTTSYLPWRWVGGERGTSR